MTEHGHENQEDGLSHRGNFNTTHWSVVITAGKGSESQARIALERLCQDYWYPLYYYCRRKGYRPHDAQDLTQSFFVFFLSNDAVCRADPNRGRFRSFLLSAFQNFLANEWDRSRAQKRGGGASFISLDDHSAENRFLHETISDASLEKSFDRRWALTLLENALSRLRQQYSSSGKSDLFETTKVFLSGDAEEACYEHLAKELDMSPQALRTAVFRLRRRYRSILTAEIAKTVESSSEVDQEMKYIFAALQ